MGKMAAEAEQIRSAVQRVGGISAQNKQQIDALMTEVSRFKVD
jgi:hypothetical protein